MPIGTSMPGLPSVSHKPPAPSTFPQVTARTVPSVEGIDVLSKRVLGLHAWSTGTFTGGPAPFNGLLVSPTNRLRVRRILWQMSVEAAYAGGAQTITLYLIQNGQATGIELSMFVPTIPQPLAPGVIVIPFDLGDGWIGQKGADVKVASTAILTSGTFRVVMFGNEEVAD